MQSSDFQALSHVVGSFLALAQTILLLPKQVKAKSILWVLALLSLIPYLANVSSIMSMQPPPLMHKHPVEALIVEASANFKELLQRQSGHPQAALTEYRRRYGIEPPPGFEAWYKFAKENQSPIIDDFDEIFNRISPFLKLSGMDFIRAMNEVQNTPNGDVWRCSVSGGRLEIRCRHHHRSFDRHYSLTFNTLLANMTNRLPGLDFLVNHLDEARVLLPPTRLPNGGNPRPKITDMPRQPTWDVVTAGCSSGLGDLHNDTATPSKQTIETYGLPFVTNISSSKDLCQHPEYKKMHGLLMSPTSFIPISGLVPVLSTGALSPMGDILFPSPAYVVEPGFKYSPSTDIPWSWKRNNLYWAGSTTGAYAHDDQWPNFQRQRFVRIAQNLQPGAQHSYLQSKDGIISVIKSSFLNSRLYDVAFTKIFQCSWASCRSQRLFFPLKSWASKDEALHSRLVFDIDGNGISGRFYKLLASKSTPLKQTLLKEWHDERLIPWKHYVPVSQGMEELPELVAFFTSTKEGKKRAKEIADAGSEWFGKAFREADMGVYVYRLLLELARLQDPMREASW